MKHEEERGVLSGLDLDACRNLDIGNEWQTGMGGFFLKLR